MKIHDRHAQGSDRPIAAMLSENDKVVGAIRYVAYQTMESVPEGCSRRRPVS